MSIKLKYGYVYNDLTNKENELPDKIGAFNVNGLQNRVGTRRVIAFTVPYNNTNSTATMEFVDASYYYSNVSNIDEKQVKNMVKNNEFPEKLLNPYKETTNTS